MNSRKKYMHCFVLVVILALCSCLGNQIAAQEKTAAVPGSLVDGRQVENTAMAADESYRIGPGDVLDITVSKQPDYSRSGVRVDNNGMIQISRDDRPLSAACKTVRELAGEIKERYLRYLRNPYVYVEVKDFQSQPIAVIGAVNLPGRFQLQKRVKLREVLTFVNGPSDRAGGSVQIIRTEQEARCDAPNGSPSAKSEGDIFLVYNLKETLTADEKANPYIRPGDIIRVPEAEQAYVIGAVKTPAPVVLKDPVTLSEAIARAGGLASEADSEKIRIIRQAKGSTAKTEIIANLKAINKRQKEDILLEANDVIEVPGPSGSKKFLGALMNTIVPRVASYPLGVIR
ncbi:MAG: polysaccharide biosynthesis/export family protein [Pyrinomonadaceae bacterium]